MKTNFLLLALILTSFTGLAQEWKYPNLSDYDRKHEGFFLSLSIGPNFSELVSDIQMGSAPIRFKFNGTGVLFDFKIGGAVAENLILHGTLIRSAMQGPKVSTLSGTQQVQARISNDVSVSESMIGGGITYYLMPSNIFFSGSIGTGNFLVRNNDPMQSANANTPVPKSTSSDRGFSMQLKVGKEMVGF